MNGTPPKLVVSCGRLKCHLPLRRRWYDQMVWWLTFPAPLATRLLPIQISDWSVKLIEAGSAADGLARAK